MVLSWERVKERFYLYSGEDPAEEGQRSDLCAQLCRECADRVNDLLKRRYERDPARRAFGERYLAALESWAAAEAFYHLALADEASTPESVSADGVQISEGERAKRAKALAEEKRLAVLPLLGEGAFYFGRA